MRIMPINNNMSNASYQKASSPSFGKLIIAKEAQKALVDCNFEGLSRLRLAAKRLEHTKHWDLKVLRLKPTNNTLGGLYQVQDRLGKKAYKGYFTPSTTDPSREVVNTPNFTFRTIDADTNEVVTIPLDFKSVKDAREAYDIMDNEKNLERATGLALHLEAKEDVETKGLSYKNAFLANLKSAREYMANKLIEKCGE